MMTDDTRCDMMTDNTRQDFYEQEYRNLSYDTIEILSYGGDYVEK